MAGRLDLMAATAFGAYTVWLRPTQGTTVTTRSATFSEAGHPIVTGDLNGDGVPDLVGADLTSNIFEVQYGRGDGTFRPGPILRNVDSPGSHSLGTPFAHVEDLNGDSRNDLIVLGYPYASPKAWVILGTGTDVLLDAAPFPLPVAPHQLFLVDLDGDGKRDLLVRGLAGDICTYFRN